MSLDPTFKAQWVAALRSGDYEQGRAALCMIGFDGVARYCCLGVAFEVANGEDAWSAEGGSSMLAAGAFGSRGYWCPPGLALAAADILTHRNDRGASFAELADYIEAEL